MSNAAVDAPEVGRGARAGGSLRLGRQRRRWGEAVVMLLLRICAFLSIATTIGIVLVLFVDGSAFFRSPDIQGLEFLTDTVWQPNVAPDLEQFHIGVWPLVAGTLLITLVALVVAVPLGLASAAYLSEYAPARVRKVLKPVLEVLAGVPTIVLGYFALTFVTPVLQSIFGVVGLQVFIFNALSAGIVVGIMIVPTIASLSEDALRAVPDELRQGSLGLGATKRQTVTKVLFPAALSGIVSAVILAFGRAVGETMIVAVAAGNLPNLTLNPLESVQAMTAYIVQTASGEAPRGTVQYQSIFAVGSLLFLITLSLNLLASRLVRRFREAY